MLQFPPDITFFIQILFFLFFWFVLKNLLFDPVLMVLDQRERRSRGRSMEAAAIREEAVRLRKEYEEIIAVAKAESLREGERIHREGEDLARDFLQKAREEAAVIQANAERRARQEMEAARQSMHDRVQELSLLVAEKVLGRSVTL